MTAPWMILTALVMILVSVCIMGFALVPSLIMTGVASAMGLVGKAIEKAGR